MGNFLGPLVAASSRSSTKNHERCQDVGRIAPQRNGTSILCEETDVEEESNVEKEKEKCNECGDTRRPVSKEIQDEKDKLRCPEGSENVLIVRIQHLIHTVTGIGHKAKNDQEENKSQRSTLQNHTSLFRGNTKLAIVALPHRQGDDNQNHCNNYRQYITPQSLIVHELHFVLEKSKDYVSRS